ncbi:formylglycine-generating enzyme family protein [Myxococcota bacterium]|nr:formylglycine-generating enzyme family protein [Myxococcota bacterium]MBU1429781.1 formylglycine-generating enzyme family protein [Myxococcota bacterium]MBU1900094.1 formylglycine-generating enzyme family protein [Myxococcota bacterium]
MTQLLTFPAWRTLSPEMISIPAGDVVLKRKQRPFPEIDYTDHQIHVDAFELMSMPVTQWLYEALMGENPSTFAGLDHPVESMSYFEAIKLCNRVSEIHGFEPHYIIMPGRVVIKRASNGFRLPTVTEYEYVYKRDGFIYGERVDLEMAIAFGATLGHYAWFNENSDGWTSPVGQKGCFHLTGLFDLYGNVSELTEANFSLSHFEPGSGEVMFMGDGIFAMSQGSSFLSTWEEVLTQRYFFHMEARWEATGFRLARTPTRLGGSEESLDLGLDQRPLRSLWDFITER